MSHPKAKVLALLRGKKELAILFIAALLIVWGIKKGIDYGAAPYKDKNCDFLYPSFGNETQASTLLLDTSPIPLGLEQRGGWINDASCLNKTPVYGVVKVSSAEDVRDALYYAIANNLEVASAGERHSMGGQSFAKGALILDMRGMNRMELDAEQRVLRVESGAKWAAIQEFLDKEGFAVQAMQSINIFTVGGTLSVNAHGIAHDPGQIAPTVRSMRIMRADGEIVVASSTENSELFHHVLGGYGLFGVILDVDLDVVSNEAYRWSTTYLDYKKFPDFYEQHVRDNKNLGLMYGRISVSPTSYLRETAVHTFQRIDGSQVIPPLETSGLTWLNRLAINFSKTGALGRWARWMLEKHLEHRIHTCVSRNEAMSQNEVCDVSRNQEMYDAMGYLKNRLPDTDILQEYFIPPDKMHEFIDGLRDTVSKNEANLLNVTIRIVHKDTITALPYAKDDRFAFVLYFNQKLNAEESKTLERTTKELIEITTNLGGTFYLPYQLFYSPEQLRNAYPEIDAFFAAKRKYDPEERFVNKWYKKYGPTETP